MKGEPGGGAPPADPPAPPETHGGVPIRRRDRFTVRADLLVAVDRGPALATNLMYRANLSWVLLCDHLRVLVQRGYVEVDVPQGTRRRVYRVTEKGHEAARAYLQLVEHLLS